jgi:hypothetical protein
VHYVGTHVTNELESIFFYSSGDNFYRQEPIPLTGEASKIILDYPSRVSPDRTGFSRS